MSEVLYQDKFCTVQSSATPAAMGHVVVFPNEPILLEDMSHDEVAHLFSLTSIASSMVFELLHPHGTNLIVCNGSHSYLDGQQNDRVILHIIPRMAEDGLGLLWQPKQGDPTEIAATADLIKEEMTFGDVKEEQTSIPADQLPGASQPKIQETKVEEKESDEDVDQRVVDLVKRHYF